MLAILNSLNAHNFLIFQPILMILVSKFMVHRALSGKTCFIIGLLSPLRTCWIHKGLESNFLNRKNIFFGKNNCCCAPWKLLYHIVVYSLARNVMMSIINLC